MEVDAEEWVYYTLSMSDTPRTDSYVAMLIAEGADADSLEHFARDLERELAAANERIRRLEQEALDIARSMLRPKEAKP